MSTEGVNRLITICINTWEPQAFGEIDFGLHLGHSHIPSEFTRATRNKASGLTSSYYYFHDLVAQLSICSLTVINGDN